MSRIFTLLLCVALCVQCSKKADPATSVAEDEFNFVFMTDIHLQPELGAHEAFKKVIDTANALNPDFIMTGGDLVFDVLRGQERSDSLFQSYKKAIKGFKSPVYNCIGNHGLYGIYEESKISPEHPDYKYGMFERHLGKSYYSFNHKGWHFIVLNSIEEQNKRFIGKVNEEQLEWLRADLENTDVKTPISVTLHIPLISAFNQRYPNNPTEMVRNADEVLKMFEGHNLRLVLQGHLHWVEDLFLEGKTHFITGGAVAGRPSWKGTRTGEEGFMLIKIKGQEVSWDYIDYGWETRFVK